MPAASGCDAGHCDVMIMGFQTQSASPFAVANLATSLGGCCAQSGQSDRHGLYTKCSRWGQSMAWPCHRKVLHAVSSFARDTHLLCVLCKAAHTHHTLVLPSHHCSSVAIQEQNYTHDAQLVLSQQTN